MAGNTQNLGLYFKEPIKDGNDTFNIQTMLNDNWNKLDDILSVLAKNKPLADYITERLQNYVKSDEKGAANGVAKLGEDGKVPADELPSMDYITTSEKGAAGGVATLGTDKKVKGEQLPSELSKSELVSYTGAGYAGSSSLYHTIIVFSFLPKIVLLSDGYGMSTFVIPDVLNTTCFAPAFWPLKRSTTAADNTMYQIPLKYNINDYTEDGVTRYSFHIWNELSGSDAAKFQFNDSNTTYTAIAIG